MAVQYWPPGTTVLLIGRRDLQALVFAQPRPCVRTWPQVGRTDQGSRFSGSLRSRLIKLENFVYSSVIFTTLVRHCPMWKHLQIGADATLGVIFRNHTQPTAGILPLTHSTVSLHVV